MSMSILFCSVSHSIFKFFTLSSHPFSIFSQQVLSWAKNDTTADCKLSLNAGSLFCRYREDSNPFVVMSFRGQETSAGKRSMSGLAIMEPRGKDALRKQWSFLNLVCRRMGNLEVAERPSWGREICCCPNFVLFISNYRTGTLQKSLWEVW